MKDQAKTQDQEQTDYDPYQGQGYTIYSLYDRIKLELLERYYALIGEYTKYHQLVLSNKDSESHRKILTTLILSKWMLIKDYTNTYGTTNEYKQLSEILDKLMFSKEILSFEGVAGCIKNISTLMVKSGISDIQRERQDKGKAILEHR